MQLHELKPIHKQKKERRVGRGGKKGTYSGRGLKGQKAHAGRKLEPDIRRWIKKYPKIKGYRQKINPQSQNLKIAVLNIQVLDKKFDSNQEITPELLVDKKIIRRIYGKVPMVKILGEGEVTKKLIIKNCKVSKQAEEKIKKAGGIIK